MPFFFCLIRLSDEVGVRARSSRPPFVGTACPGTMIGSIKELVAARCTCDGEMDTTWDVSERARLLQLAAVHCHCHSSECRHSRAPVSIICSYIIIIFFAWNFPRMHIQLQWTNWSRTGHPLYAVQRSASIAVTCTKCGAHGLLATHGCTAALLRIDG